MMNRIMTDRLAGYLGDGTVSPVSSMDEAGGIIGICVAGDKGSASEKTIELGSDHAVVETLGRMCQEIELNPFVPGPKVDSLGVSRVIYVPDDGHYVAGFYGGANGGGDKNKLQNYLMLVRKLVAAIQAEFKTEVWMCGWDCDSIDDRWEVRLGFRLADGGKEVQDEKVGNTEYGTVTLPGIAPLTDEKRRG